jgi:carboxymethylenebutenolidase
MPVKGEWTRHGDLSGYFAVPDRAATPLPGVVVIQEIGGANANIEDITRRIAAAGYAAFAPDLFEIDGKRPEALSKERIDEAFDFMYAQPPTERFDPVARKAAIARLPEAQGCRIDETIARMWSMPAQIPALVAPLRKAFGYLATERPETRGRKIGCVGFCMGGGLSTLLACEEPGLSGAAVFYGNAPAADRIAGIRCPVIGFYAANDQRVNAGIPAFDEAMRREGKSFEYHMYENANHAFFNDAGPSYNVDAARDSFARMLSFFSKTLTG